MTHPYYQSAKAEQRQEALDAYKIEAVRYLESQARTKPVVGRVLEDTRH